MEMEIEPTAGVQSAGELLDDAEVHFSTAKSHAPQCAPDDRAERVEALFSHACLSLAASNIALAQFVHRGVVALERANTYRESARRRADRIEPALEGALPTMSSWITSQAELARREVEMVNAAQAAINRRVHRLRAIELQFGLTPESVSKLTEAQMREVLTAVYDATGDAPTVQDETHGEVAGA